MNERELTTLSNWSFRHESFQAIEHKFGAGLLQLL